MDLLDRCLARPGKNYPAGYGFALAYLDNHLNPAHLRDAACAMVAEAFGPNGTATDRKDDDLAAFVLAYGEAEQAEDWLIEAAQLLLSYGMAGNPVACNALALAGHSGYNVTPTPAPAAPEPDAYYVELVDAEGDRHWSDVMMNDVDRATLIESTIGLCECENRQAPGLSLRFHALNLAQPVFTAPFEVES